MNRCAGTGFREPVGVALQAIPAAIRERLSGVSFFCGADPVFAGLHSYEDTEDDRSYRDTGHCLYPFHQLHRPADDRPTTIVLPVVEPPKYVVHEIGHAVDELTGFTHLARPVTKYAKTNRREAFAEAFTAWLWPGYIRWVIDDPATRCFFEGLL